MWFFVIASGAACVLVVMGFVDWRSHIYDRNDIATTGYFQVGFIRYLGNAVLGLLVVLALIGLMSVVEVAKEARRGGRKHESH